MEPVSERSIVGLSKVDVEPQTWNTYLRLYSTFYHGKTKPLTPTRLHDLTSFVIHRLLATSLEPSETPTMTLSNCLARAIILYLLILQGPIYYTNAFMSSRTISQLLPHLAKRTMSLTHASVDLWVAAVGLVASYGTPHYVLLQERVRLVSSFLHLAAWEDASSRIKDVLWLETPHMESVFQSHWDVALGHNCPLITLPSLQIAPATNISRPQIET